MLILTFVVQNDEAVCQSTEFPSVRSQTEETAEVSLLNGTRICQSWR